MSCTLTMTSIQKLKLQEYLLQDNNERVAWALCGQATNGLKKKLTIYEFFFLEAKDYIENRPNRVNWKTDFLMPLLEKAEEKGLTLVKFHNHPRGCNNFSVLDDNSDREVFRSIHNWFDETNTVASCILLPDGQIFGRCIDEKLEFYPIDKVVEVGSSIIIHSSKQLTMNRFNEKNVLAFGEDTYSSLQQLRVAVVGASGTGSQVIEQLVRNGVKELVIIDDDVVKEKNLNRITNTGIEDSDNEELKVFAIKKTLDGYGLGADITAIPKNIKDKSAIKELSTCDVVFGCVDTAEGRHIINKAATYYSISYIDIGVGLEAKPEVGINSVSAAVHYIQPGEKPLIERDVYTSEDLANEYNNQIKDGNYEDDLNRGYIKGAIEDRPAVISLNSCAASLAVLDLIARLDNFRYIENDEVDKISVSISGEIFRYEKIEGTKDKDKACIGRGNCERPLGLTL